MPHIMKPCAIIPHNKLAVSLYINQDLSFATNTEWWIGICENTIQLEFKHPWRIMYRSCALSILEILRYDIATVEPAALFSASGFTRYASPRFYHKAAMCRDSIFSALQAILTFVELHPRLIQLHRRFERPSKLFPPVDSYSKNLHKFHLLSKYIRSRVTKVYVEELIYCSMADLVFWNLNSTIGPPFKLPAHCDKSLGQIQFMQTIQQPWIYILGQIHFMQTIQQPWTYTLAQIHFTQMIQQPWTFTLK